MLHSENVLLLIEKMKNANIQHKKERKLAIFVHGWSANSLTCWGVFGHSIIPAMFDSMGYEVVFIDMPGMYMLPKKGFEYYAKFLAKKIEEISRCPLYGGDFTPPVEITLIAHSMGGVACRLYLQDNNIGKDKEIKSKVKKLITIASPHHGTNPKIENIFRSAINKLIDILKKNGVEQNFKYEDLHWSKCYQELLIEPKKLGLVYKLNNKMAFPKQVEFYSIWSIGDYIVDPVHTAVSDYAKNYVIDKRYVTHLNILASLHTYDILLEILRGESLPTGLQKYPKECDCEKNDKQWIPTPFMYEKHKFLWGCINTETFEKNGEVHTKTCPEKHIQKYRPGIVGCDIGLMEKRYHTWAVTGKKRWTCQKCGTTHEGSKHPKYFEKNNCKNPFPSWHRWKLDWSEWKCKNCGIIKNSFLVPPSSGCEEGIYHGERLHEWKKIHKIYEFSFKCTNCGKEKTIEVPL